MEYLLTESDLKTCPVVALLPMLMFKITSKKDFDDILESNQDLKLDDSDDSGPKTPPDSNSDDESSRKIARSADAANN